MPRAEAGTTKALANKMKSKGLGRLRWYCQVCEKQCRDENGFKCHTQSESHVRKIQAVGEDTRKAISEYSQQFHNDFIRLLRTSHVEKAVHINQFYQEYIRDKNHIHMNASRWHSLTDYGKYLGREGICRVTENEKGMFIAWIDNSPEALRRRDAVRRKERQDRGDEIREQKQLEAQIARAQQALKEKEAEQAANSEGENEEATTQVPPPEGQKFSFSLKLSKAAAVPEPIDAEKDLVSPETADSTAPSAPPNNPAPFKLSFGNKPAAVIKPPPDLFKKEKSSSKDKTKATDTGVPPEKLNVLDRILLEEKERKRRREERIMVESNKRARVST